MKYIFLIICNLLASLITISGFLSLKSPSDLPPLLLFIPVTLYFWISLIKLFKSSRQTPVSLAGKKFQLLILFLILLVLTSIGYKNIGNQVAPAPIEPSPLIIHITPTPTPLTPQTLTVFHQDPKALINIRELPSSASAILAKLPVGTVVTLLTTEDNWHKINFDSTTSGWLFADFAK